MSLPSLPSNWPTVTPGALIIGLIVFVFITLITFLITKSRWSWFPGLFFGVIAAIAVNPYNITISQVVNLVQIIKIIGYI